jgi:hypothetical protein
MNSTSERVRALNDELRRTFTGGTLVVTPGIRDLDPGTLRQVDDAIRTFTKFDRDNDPCDEHDFGSVTVSGCVIFFKIDYYDLDLRNHSPDPADPEVTRRVLTLMLAEEY